MELKVSYGRITVTIANLSKYITAAKHAILQDTCKDYLHPQQYLFLTSNM